MVLKTFTVIKMDCFDYLISVWWPYCGTVQFARTTHTHTYILSSILQSLLYIIKALYHFLISSAMKILLHTSSYNYILKRKLLQSLQLFYSIFSLHFNTTYALFISLITFFFLQGQYSNTLFSLGILKLFHQRHDSGNCPSRIY